MSLLPTETNNLINAFDYITDNIRKQCLKRSNFLSTENHKDQKNRQRSGGKQRRDKSKGRRSSSDLKAGAVGELRKPVQEEVEVEAGRCSLQGNRDH